MEYYVVLNRERKGPLTIEQLKTIGLTPNTLVWCKGMPNWAKAQEVAELVEILGNKEEAPVFSPELPDKECEDVAENDYAADKEDTLRAKRKKNLIVCVGVLAAILIISLVAYFVNKLLKQDNEVASLTSPKWSASVTEQQKAIINQLLGEMVCVEGGVFAMGQRSSAQSVNNYYISKYEITQSQWEAVIGTTVSQQRLKHSGDRLTGVGSDLPMYYVNQNEAKDFCAELSRITGLSFDLPTEAQWEYAAKGAGNDNYIYSGSDYLHQVAWYGENYAYGSVHPVGQLAANSLGIYDMSGNVWEWCRETSILRGGCILHDESKCRVTWSWSEPNYYKGFNRGGFRIVME